MGFDVGSISYANTNKSIIDQKALARVTEQIFKPQQDFDNPAELKPVPRNNPAFIDICNDISVKPLFSPQDNIINTEIIPLINSAKKSIYMPMFFITHNRYEGENELIVKALR